MNRYPSSLSRELTLDLGALATRHHWQANQLRLESRRNLKLVEDNSLFEVVKDHLKKNWSPEQIAGTLKHLRPDQQASR